jgi:uncharacterized membrane protein YfcA
MVILAIFISGLVAGFFGSLVGLGGGVIMVPLLNLIFGLPIKTAVATSLVAICATSIGGTARYLKSNLVDYRMGLFLETTTIVGAIAGGLVALVIKPQILSVAFAIILIYTSVNMLTKLKRKESPITAGLAQSVSTARKYIALALSGIAGMVSAMLGVGGGVVKVPIIHLILGYPIKNSTATSTFMIGLTAAAGSLVYFIAQTRGSVDYVLIDYHAVAPLVIGTLAGSTIGATVAGKLNARAIKIVFIVALLYAGLRIGLRGLGIELL